MKNHKTILSLVLALFIVGLSFAQQGTVSGTVSDADGAPLPGATVVIKGTTTGVTTDFDGNFTIQAAADAVLVASFVGFASQEIPVSNQSNITFVLSTDNLLDEVVLTGYGQTTVRNATNSVSTVKAEDFNNGIISSPEQLFQGKSAGVQITSSNGEPGAGINIRIRGTASVRANNNPLFVVDGVPLSGSETTSGQNDIGRGGSTAKNPLNFINPSDIERIDILKDASATAIYGSRGANGVVLITTKNGAGSKKKFEYSTALSVSQVANTYDLLDREEFIDAVVKFGGKADVSDFGGSTDWQDEIYRTTLSQNHNLTFSNSHDSGNYRASLSFDDQQGIVENSSMTRMNARLNLRQNFLDNQLKVDLNLAYSNVDDKAPLISNDVGFEGDLLGAAIMANPTWPSYYGSQFSTTNVNPNSLLEYYSDEANTKRTLINLSGRYTVNDEISVKLNLGLDKSVGERGGAFSKLMNIGSGVFGNGRGYVSDTETDNQLLELTGTYTKDFDNSKLTALAGFSYQKFSFEGGSAQGWGFETVDIGEMIGIVDQSMGAVSSAIGTTFYKYGIDDNDSFYTTYSGGENQKADFSAPTLGLKSIAYNGYKNEDELQSFFTRVEYSMLDKYILTGSLRADGSSKFGDNNKYGLFPSIGAAWIMSDEDFIPDFFTNLKLRGGFGIIGNQEIPHNLYQRRQAYADIDIDDGGNINPNDPGLSDVAFANPDLKWESTEQFNIGIDFSLFEGRLNASAEYYNKKTKDMLMSVFAAQPAPQPFIWTNLDAVVENKGYEFTLNLALIDNSKWSWELDLNASFNDNIVTNLGDSTFDTGVIRGQGLTGAFAQRIANNQPLYAFFLRPFIGYDENGISLYTEDRQQFLDGKSPLPKSVSGLNSTWRFGEWDLNVFFAGQFGHYIYNNTANALFTAGSIGNARNVTYETAYSGESNLNAPDVSTRFLEKGDFIRLQNLTLGRNIKLNEDSVFDTLRLYATGQNLLLFTDYSGLDPEVDVQNPINDIPSAGLDYTSYPKPRTFTFGINATF